MELVFRQALEAELEQPQLLDWIHTVHRLLEGEVDVNPIYDEERAIDDLLAFSKREGFDFRSELGE